MPDFRVILSRVSQWARILVDIATLLICLVIFLGLTAAALDSLGPHSFFQDNHRAHPPTKWPERIIMFVGFGTFAAWSFFPVYIIGGSLFRALFRRGDSAEKKVD